MYIINGRIISKISHSVSFTFRRDFSNYSKVPMTSLRWSYFYGQTFAHGRIFTCEPATTAVRRMRKSFPLVAFRKLQKVKSGKPLFSTKTTPRNSLSYFFIRFLSLMSLDSFVYNLPILLRAFLYNLTQIQQGNIWKIIVYFKFGLVSINDAKKK